MLSSRSASPNCTRRSLPSLRNRRLLRLAALGAGCAWLVATTIEAQDGVGLSSVRAQRLGREVLPNANVDGDDFFGFAFAIGDFDGDGAEDLATGAPTSDGASASPVDQCGQVVVRYGVAGAGLDPASSPVVLGQFLGGFAEPADIFGRALAACDVNDDGFDDLAVGVPLEDLTLGGTVTIFDSGVVEVYLGSSAGLSAPATTVLSSNGIQSGSQKLGWAVACGDFDHDGFDDVVAGLPGRIVNGNAGAGRILVWPGSSGGVGPGVYGLDQDSTNIEGVADANDQFGSQLAVGDFDGDAHSDLAVAVPTEVLAATDSIGVVQVIYGGPDGLTGTDHIITNHDVAGDLDEGSFGNGLAAGDFDGDTFDDLAIGSPGDDADVTSGGSVYLHLGSPGGLGQLLDRFSGEQLFGAGASEPLDNFGYALAAGDFDGDGFDDFAIGSPGEDVLGNNDGAVTIVLGSEGPSQTRARRIHHGLEGFPGSPDEHDLQFGQGLAAGDFDGDGHADLAIGAPIEVEAGLPQVGTATILYGALFADGFESGSEVYWDHQQ